MSPTGVELLEVDGLMPAAPERVFEAWTTADQLKAWFGRPEGFDVPEVDVDLRVGGAYRIVLAAGEARSTVTGVYQEIVRPERLVFTFAWDPVAWDVMDTGETLVTVRFAADDGGTRVRLSQERLKDRPTVEFHGMGWRLGFERLERLLTEEEET